MVWSNLITPWSLMIRPFRQEFAENETCQRRTADLANCAVCWLFPSWTLGTEHLTGLSFSESRAQKMRCMWLLFHRHLIANRIPSFEWRVLEVIYFWKRWVTHRILSKPFPLRKNTRRDLSVWDKLTYNCVSLSPHHVLRSKWVRKRRVQRALLLSWSSCHFKLSTSRNTCLRLRASRSAVDKSFHGKRPLKSNRSMLIRHSSPLR